MLQLLQGRGGIALGFEQFGFGQILFGLLSRFGRHMLVEELANLGFRQRADETIDRLTAGEHHAKRNRAHAEHLAELAGDFRLLVAVELGQQEAAFVSGFELFQDRAELLAGAAPGGPDIEQNRPRQGGLDQVGLEVFQGDVDHRVAFGMPCRPPRLKLHLCLVRSTP